MQSTFSGIEIGKRSLIAHNVGLTTVGHNLSNAATEGYSRQRVEMKAFDPIYRPQLNRAETAGQIGQGVDVARIERIRDGILEGRIVSQANGEGYWESRDKYLRMVEQVYNEPADTSVRHLMDQFWNSWQELSMYPEQMASRQAVLQHGKALIDGIHNQYNSLDRIRQMLDEDIRGTVKQVNDQISDIAKLNEEIVKSKAAGDSPNDLLDQRDLLVEHLSKIINITVDKRDPDEFSVYTSGLHIIQGKIARPFTTVPDTANEGYSKVAWKYSGEDALFRGGKLAALQQMRDVDVRGEIQNLDNMAVNFTDLVNDIHRSAYGLDGKTNTNFFVEHPAVLNAQGNYDRNGDGAFDSTYLFRVTGANQLQAKAQIGLEGTLTFPGQSDRVRVNYYPTDTVGDLVARINNSSAEVAARLDRNGHLVLKGTPAAQKERPDFVLRYMEDSGQLLGGYAGILRGPGPENAFTWGQPDASAILRPDAQYALAPLSHPSAWIGINEDIQHEPASIAASFKDPGETEGDPGDGSAAIEIAGLRNRPVMVGQTATFDDYFADTVANIGLKGQESELALKTQQTIMKDLRDTRQSISGVNIDEEIAQMIKYQHGYNAAARFVTNINQMLDTIINRMGV